MALAAPTPRPGDSTVAMPRQTKIIATLGPACASAEGVRELVAAGMDVARLNFSHGSYASHEQFADWVRQASEDEGRPVALLQDIQGPKIRVGTFPGGEVELTRDATVRLQAGGDTGGPELVYIDYPHLLGDIAVGDEVLLADGRIRLEVSDSGAEALTARVTLGGILRDHGGAAFPGASLRMPPITEKDRKDLDFGRQLGVDWVAASFVCTGADILEVARLSGSETPIIAKIERASAYHNLADILSACHGAMVARGDLGVELPLERLPMVQQDILNRTNRAGRISITATEMLESMTQSPRPTRAEVTDVASSVLGGTDAVMLSGETAQGRYPGRAVAAMDSICRAVESSAEHLGRTDVAFLPSDEPIPSAAARAAVQAARSLELKTIVAFTETGNTARLISKYRPEARIVAFTPVAETCRRMALYWGVQPRMFGRQHSTDDMILETDRQLLRSGICSRGETVVIVAGVPPNRRASTNLIKLHHVGSEPGLDRAPHA